MIKNLRFHIMGNLLTSRRTFSCSTITASHGDSYIIAAITIRKNIHIYIWYVTQKCSIVKLL